VQQRDQGADAELPFEAEPDVDGDGGQGGDDGDDAAVHQLGADLGADRFGAAQVVFVADRILDQLDRHLLAPFGALVGRHVDARVLVLPRGSWRSWTVRPPGSPHRASSPRRARPGP
jgi:hypothetical protein